MLKKLFSWLWFVGKRALIELIRSQEDELEELIRQNVDPKKLSKKIIDWIIQKIESL